MYDVVIVGAGPAGSTLARLLDPSLRVLLVDRRELGDAAPRRAAGKPCGGLLAPAAQRELARQQLGVPSHVATGPQLFAVRAVDADTGIERRYQRQYVNTDREAFDRWLVSLVSENVERAFGWSFERLEVGASTRREVPTVHFATSRGGRAGVRARLVVGADGASSALRRAAGGRQARRYAAVQARFDTSAHDAHYGAIFCRKVTDFYGWTIPKPDGLLAGVAVRAGSGAAAAFDAFVRIARDAGFPLGAEVERGAATLVRPGGPGDIFLGTRSVALVGEAAGLVSPSSGEGVSYALRSAALLASVVNRALVIEGAAELLPAYRQAVAPLAFEVLGKTAKARALGSPAVRRAVMRSGLGALPERPTGDLVEAFGL